jgi:hypothetical protein
LLIGCGGGGGGVRGKKKTNRTDINHFVWLQLELNNNTARSKLTLKPGEEFTKIV